MAVNMLWMLLSIWGLSVAADVQLGVQKLLERIESLEHSHDRLEEIVNTQQKTIDRYEKEMSRLTKLEADSELPTGNSEQKRLTTSSSSPAAFSAYINHFINTMAVNEVIPFEMVTTNEGNAFDGKAGIFTCNNPGLYLFVWNIMVDSGHGTQAKLMVNGVTRRWSNAYSTGHYANAANHDIVRLEEGDRVWLADGYASGEIHPHHTTFSGVLLHN